MRAPKHTLTSLIICSITALCFIAASVVIARAAGAPEAERIATIERIAVAETPTDSGVTRRGFTSAVEHAEVRQVLTASAQAERVIKRATRILTRPYEFNERSTRVRALQRLVGAHVDGHYGYRTRLAHLGALEFLGLPTTKVPAAPPVVTAPASGSSRCPQYEGLALEVGWPASEIPHLSYVMWRESRCNPRAHNPRPPDDSYGLIQLNMLAHRSWVGPLVGWDFTRLYDPETNLSIGLRLWHMAGGWGPWRVG